MEVQIDIGLLKREKELSAALVQRDMQLLALLDELEALRQENQRLVEHFNNVGVNGGS